MLCAFAFSLNTLTTASAEDFENSTTIDIHQLVTEKSTQFLEKIDKYIDNLTYLQKNQHILQKIEEYSYHFAEKAFQVRRDCVEFLKKNFLNSENLLVMTKEDLSDYNAVDIVKHLTDYNVESIQELLSTVVVVFPEILVIEIIKDEQNFLELEQEDVEKIITRIYKDDEYATFRKEWNTGTSVYYLAAQLYGEEFVRLLSEYIYIDESMLSDDDFETGLRNLFFETRQIQSVTSSDKKQIKSDSFFETERITRNGYFEGLLIMHASLNRVEDTAFPDEFEKVIYQKNQFTWANHKRNQTVDLTRHREKDILTVLNILVLDGFRFFSFVKSSMNFNLSSNLEKFVGICFYMKGKPNWTRKFENIISGDHHFFRNPSSNLLRRI